MNVITQHLRVYAALVKFSLSKSMEFRIDFFFRFFMDVFFYGLTIAFFEVLFLHTDSLGGWDRPQILFFISISMVLDGVFMTVFARNIWEFPTLVNRGELDFLLIRPVAPLFLALTRNFEFASLMNVVVALGIMGYALSLFPDPFTFTQIIGTFFLFIIGIILLLAIRMFTVLPVFWTHSDMGFHMLFMSLSQVMERPEVIFRGITHLIFTTIFPFIVMTSFPARWFFGDLGMLEVLYAIGLTAVFVAVLLFVWSRGLRTYSSASS